MTGGLKKKVAILISGRGSNMASLIAAAAENDYPCEIVGVISNRADARGLETAERIGLATKVVDQSSGATKDERDAVLDQALREMGAEIVCLAGYMRLLSASFVSKWEGRIINIHPSLLPLFPGLDTHRRALEAGLRIHGCTVHFVTAQMDAGPIVAQAAVPVGEGDDADRLSARVLKAEHQLYPLALRLVAEGRARMEGGRTILSNVASGSEGVLMVPGSASESIDIESLARMTP
jgi:phosphoribosylglycinamide formyltransferase 1